MAYDNIEAPTALANNIVNSPNELWTFLNQPYLLTLIILLVGILAVLWVLFRTFGRPAGSY